MITLQSSHYKVPINFSLRVLNTITMLNLQWVLILDYCNYYKSIKGLVVKIRTVPKVASTQVSGSTSLSWTNTVVCKLLCFITNLTIQLLKNEQRSVEGIPGRMRIFLEFSNFQT